MNHTYEVHGTLHRLGRQVIVIRKEATGLQKQRPLLAGTCSRVASALAHSLIIARL